MSKYPTPRLPMHVVHLRLDRGVMTPEAYKEALRNVEISVIQNQGLLTERGREGESAVIACRFAGERRFDDILAALKSWVGWPEAVEINLVKGA